jgi:predicted DNA-binding helix-hairpin-helix protein
MDCAYCPFAVYCRRARETWRPEKLIRVFLESYRRGLVRGLFLSSGLNRDPEEVSLALVETVEALRRRGYRGYVNLRLMPGTPGWLIRRALEVADRVGINLEAPGGDAFAEIAPSKGSWSLDLYSRLLLAADYARSPGRVTTQFVVGSAGETDWELVKTTWALHRAGVGVVHYSPFTPVPGTRLAERGAAPAPEWRTRLLYEASRLLRDYGLRPRDLEPVLGDDGMFPRLRGSLKEAVAAVHPEWFPVDPEAAPPGELARVPGIGPRSARRIVEVRERGERITPWLLARILGPARFRRAAPYLALRG